MCWHVNYTKVHSHLTVVSTYGTPKKQFRLKQQRWLNVVIKNIKKADEPYPWTMLNDKFLDNLLPCQTNWHDVSTAQPMFFISISNQCMIQKRKKKMSRWSVSGCDGCVETSCRASSSPSVITLKPWLIQGFLSDSIWLAYQYDSEWLVYKVRLFCYCLVLSLSLLYWHSADFWH